VPTRSAAGSLETSPNLTEDDPIMTIPPECEAQSLRYFHVEKWPPTTIPRHLNINRGTVKRLLVRADLPPIGLRPPPARIDPYLPFIHQTLEKFPMLAASRLSAFTGATLRGSGPDPPTSPLLVVGPIFLGALDIFILPLLCSASQRDVWRKTSGSAKIF
jgi:hypothetical protein